MSKFLNRLFSFNASRFRLYEEVKNFAANIPESAYVLDAGSGNQPYKHLLSHANYESADFEQIDKSYAQTTYVCNLNNIPTENARFDYILFNQVMEHLPEPLAVLKELNRVLKPNGKILYSGPLFYEEHQVPYDFYRYTQYALINMFTSSGFKVERLEWLEGYFGTVAYQFNRMAVYLPVRPGDMALGYKGFFLSPILFIVKKLSWLLSVFFNRLELKVKFTAAGYPKNYIGVFRKSE
jgi:SAM-dependent methyltransferase